MRFSILFTYLQNTDIMVQNIQLQHIMNNSSWAMAPSNIPPYGSKKQHLVYISLAYLCVQLVIPFRERYLNMHLRVSSVPDCACSNNNSKTCLLGLPKNLPQEQMFCITLTNLISIAYTYMSFHTRWISEYNKVLFDSSLK